MDQPPVNDYDGHNGLALCVQVDEGAYEVWLVVWCKGHHSLSHLSSLPKYQNLIGTRGHAQDQGLR